LSERRFTEKAALNPAAVTSLGEDHPAMRENRTLFPTTVVTVTDAEPDRLLVSGKNNRKIGATVEKGRFKGYSIYCLTLEERATCPVECEARAYCYGNAMQLARRHRIGDADVFFDRLGFEIAGLLDEHDGLLIRLHVLGDFPSTDYVAFWKDVLDEHPNVACFGYTHRSPTSWGGDEIGDAIQAVKDAHPDRFRIRWSSPVARKDGAVVVDHVQEGPRLGDGSIVCPSQRDATACCATCALCWEADHSIAFIKHGPKSGEVEAAKAMERMAPEAEKEPDQASDHRVIRPIPIAGLSPSAIRVQRPRFVDVDPRKDLIVETKYQRDLSAKSLKLIRRIVERFDWSKFKPPVCVEHGDGFFVIDGQHTAIGAASHPDIKTIPVMVVDAGSVEARAASFVAHNRDRVAMSSLQVFHGEVAAGSHEASEILRLVDEAGGRVPRNPVGRRDARVGDVVSIAELEHIYGGHGGEKLKEIIRIAVEGRCRPISTTVLRAIRMLVTEPQYEDVRRDDLVTALMARPDIEQAAIRFGMETNQGRHAAAAVILYRATCSLSGRKAA
jgi:hypothetical protein